MLLVDPGLYIGTVADLNDSQGLAAAAVTHILSVDSVDPAPLVPADGNFRRKWVNVLDEAGRSRSATIITSYLMKKHQLSFTEASLRLKAAKRTSSKVNSGFEEQLCLYEALHCEVDTSSPLYKQYRLSKIIEKYPEMRHIPRELFAADPPTAAPLKRALFRGSSVLSHSVGGGGAQAFGYRKSRDVQCTSYFIEPVQWMEPALVGVMDGQLLCPKCSSKLGSFSWCGDRCSCGSWVTPAFQLHHNRVDEIRQINIQK
ncbi:hypothetical protein F7725_012054 [Dissostichus mawsoni]|uniref:protein-tyrosine-phosphatase n=1 Tax=Dissostichus mawsoni TaxID=36200 RepID=A0A7J5ZBB5_DISMA|nr:hypothetical protein F7725_012054 [Dissostichus mawsoni]